MDYDFHNDYITKGYSVYDKFPVSLDSPEMERDVSLLLKKLDNSGSDFQVISGEHVKSALTREERERADKTRYFVFYRKGSSQLSL